MGESRQKHNQAQATFLHKTSLFAQKVFFTTAFGLTVFFGSGCAPGIPNPALHSPFKLELSDPASAKPFTTRDKFCKEGSEETSTANLLNVSYRVNSIIVASKSVGSFYVELGAIDGGSIPSELTVYIKEQDCNYYKRYSIPKEALGYVASYDPAYGGRQPLIFNYDPANHELSVAIREDPNASDYGQKNDRYVELVPAIRLPPSNPTAGFWDLTVGVRYRETHVPNVKEGFIQPRAVTPTGSVLTEFTDRRVGIAIPDRKVRRLGDGNWVEVRGTLTPSDPLLLSFGLWY